MTLALATAPVRLVIDVQDQTREHSITTLYYSHATPGTLTVTALATLAQELATDLQAIIEGAVVKVTVALDYIEATPTYGSDDAYKSVDDTVRLIVPAAGYGRPRITSYATPAVGTLLGDTETLDITNTAVLAYLTALDGPVVATGFTGVDTTGRQLTATAPISAKRQWRRRKGSSKTL